MKIEARKFAQEWIDDWNSHDIERILSHYSDDFEITTPMISAVLGQDLDRLVGKNTIREYWRIALKKIPNLKFELKDVAVSANSIAIYYKSVMNRMGVEVMYFNENNKVNCVVAHYTDASQ